MNERIKELALHSGLEMCGCGCDMPTRQSAKFAELIVQECIDIVGDGGEFASRPKLVEKLQKHFGVEE
jgi:hypothetical protein